MGGSAKLLRKKNIFFVGVMAEWLMRGTVNTFFSGSIPLDAFFFAPTERSLLVASSEARSKGLFF